MTINTRDLLAQSELEDMHVIRAMLEIGHVLRTDPSDVAKTALPWTPKTS